MEIDTQDPQPIAQPTMRKAAVLQALTGLHDALARPDAIVQMTEWPGESALLTLQGIERELTVTFRWLDPWLEEARQHVNAHISDGQ